MRQPIQSALAALALAAAASAQGADDCSSAQVIVGTGVFPFDNSAATTDGSADPLCLAGGQSQIELDVWWAWTAPQSGRFTVDTCAQTAIDTRLAVLDGACNAPVLDCDDDACGLQSEVGFDAVGGNVYFVRLGVFPGSPGGTGTLTIALELPPQVVQTAVNPANGRTYHLLEPADWTVSEAAAVALGGHLVTIDNQAENDWVITTFKNQAGVDIDMWIGFNDQLVEGQFEWSSGAPIGFLNWDLGEPNNGGGNEDYTALRKNNALGLWNDLSDHPVGFHADVQGVVELGGGVVFCTAKTGLACTPGGAPSILDTGSSSATQSSGFVISAGPARTCKSGLLIYNTGQIAPGIPFEGGTLCVDPMGLRRAGPMNSKGTPGGGNCDGMFSMDMNAFAQNLWVVPDCAGAPSGLPPNNAASFLTTPGQAVSCQIWGRDSVATGSFLSNGLQYMVGP